MQKGRRELLWKRRDIFKGLGKMKNMKQVTALKSDVKPVCKPMQQRPLKDEEVEKQKMQSSSN